MGGDRRWHMLFADDDDDDDDDDSSIADQGTAEGGSCVGMDVG